MKNKDGLIEKLIFYITFIVFFIIGFNSFLHLLTNNEAKACFQCIKKHMHANSRLIIDIYIPKFNSSIRLPNAAGEWYLRRIDDTSTEVVYTWNGELGGDFPSFALTRAWTTQGNEMIVWLKESLDELYTNRE